jgi:hypothetical protein
MVDGPTFDAREDLRRAATARSAGDLAARAARRKHFLLYGALMSASVIVSGARTG